MSRDLRKEMSRHNVDVNEINIGVSHGNVTLHGRIRALKGHEVAFEGNLAAMLKSLRAHRGVRDVLPEWTVVL